MCLCDSGDLVRLQEENQVLRAEVLRLSRENISLREGQIAMAVWYMRQQEGITDVPLFTFPSVETVSESVLHDVARGQGFLPAGELLTPDGLH